MLPFTIRKLDRHYYAADIPQHPTRLQAYSFFFLLSGTVLVEIGEKGYLIKEGELVIIPVGQFFAIKYFDRSEGYMGSFSPNYFGEDVPERNIFKRFDFLRVWGHPVIEFGRERAETVAVLFQRVYDESMAAGRSEELIKSYLISILFEADVVYQKSAKEKFPEHNNVGNSFLDLLFCGKQIKRNVAEYAQMLNVSPNHLNKMVRRLTSKSPSQWIEEAVIKEAKMLLRNTEMPLGEIAASLGIMDQSYFSRMFRKSEGISPSQYRISYKTGIRPGD